MHEYLECGKLVFAEVDGGGRHVGIDCLGEERHVALGVAADALDEGKVFSRVEVLLDVRELNVQHVGLLVGDLLKVDQVLALTVDRVLGEGGVRVLRQELCAACYKEGVTGWSSAYLSLPRSQACRGPWVDSTAYLILLRNFKFIIIPPLRLPPST